LVYVLPENSRVLSPKQTIRSAKTALVIQLPLPGHQAVATAQRATCRLLTAVIVSGKLLQRVKLANTHWTRDDAPTAPQVELNRSKVHAMNALRAELDTTTQGWDKAHVTRVQ
jgi:hypothetical protein